MIEYFSQLDMFELITCFICIGGVVWTSLLLLLTAIQICWKWVDDDKTITYNIILRYMMVNWYGYTIIKYTILQVEHFDCTGSYLYRHINFGDSDGFIAYWYGLIYIACLGGLAFLLTQYFITVTIACVVIGSLPVARFIVRLNKKVTKLEKIK